MNSVITACKNRNENLLKSVKSWVLIPDIVEIVIVDFDSDIPVIETLHDILLKYNHVKIIHVKNQPKWVLTIAMNLASRFTANDGISRILKLDSDDVLETNFFEYNKLKPGTFLAGNWKNSRNHNEKHLNGILYVYKKDFFAVNGYNEFLTKYGYDDTCVYERLVKYGLTQKDINNDTVRHIEHSDKMRSSTNLFNDIHYNRFLSQLLPWNDKNEMCSFECYNKKILLNHKFINYVAVKLVKNYAKVEDDVASECQNMLNNYLEVLRKIEIEKNKNKNVLYIRTRNGMGNVIRALLSAYSLYNYLKDNSKYNKFKWRFVIIWIPDYHCEASFFDLFKKIQDPNVSVTTEIPVVTSKTLQIFDRNLFDEQIMTPQEEIEEIFNKIEHSKVPVEFYLESASIINFPTSNWVSDCSNLRHLILRDDVQKIVYNTVKNIPYDMKSLIALQIRIGQSEMAFDDVSKWSEDKKKSWYHWRNCSNLERYISVIEKYLKKDDTTKFYMTSDSKSVYDKLLELYPNNIYCIRRTCFDRSVEQVKIGLAEIIIISKCDVGYLSNWSSYNETICRYNNNMKKNFAGIDF